MTTDNTTKAERWVVRYRRYHSDPWSEKVFTSAATANDFAHNYYSSDQTDAQTTVKHFVEIGND